MSTGRADHAVTAHVARAAHVAFGAAAAGLGALCLIAGDLAYIFQPVPRWMPLRPWWSYASGAILVAAGLALLARKTTRLAALVLTVHFAAWLLLFNLPTTLSKPSVVGYWEGCGLNMTVLAGAWILLARSARPAASLVASPTGDLTARLLGDRGITLARLIFAFAVPLVGIAHFVNAQEATVYVPTWLPLRIDWVYLTGAAHIAAGLAILFGVVPRLAAILEAAQITAFVILSHIPEVCSTPRDRLQWAMLVYALAIAAGAWLVASTFDDRPEPRR